MRVAVICNKTGIKEKDDKRCPGCGAVKVRSEFNKRKRNKDGMYECCRECQKNKGRQYKEKYPGIDRAHYLKHREMAIAKAMEKYWDNPEYYRQKCRDYYIKHREYNCARSIKYAKEHRQEVRISKRNYERKRRRENIVYKLHSNIRAAISRCFQNRQYKSFNLIQNCGYTLKDLKCHLELKFQEGMNWDNYGFGSDKWNIDHIVPIAAWNITSTKDESFKKCWGLNNLQPLWQIDNLKKGKKIL